MIKQQIKAKLDTVLVPWFALHGIEVMPAYVVEEPPKGIVGDLACNAALLTAKLLKKNPRAVAEEMIADIRKAAISEIAAVDIAGAGFINLTLADGYMHQIVQSRLGGTWERGADVPTEKMLLEFVSANPTGPLHIGHGRGAAIGDSLARIYRFLGYDITTEYYLNDVGNQMLMLAQSVQARYDDLKGTPTPLPENGYQGEYIRDIARALIEKKREEIDFKKEAVEAIMGSIRGDLGHFRVLFDSWFSESMIAVAPVGKKSLVDDVCAWMLAQGHAYEQDGALWFASTKYGDEKDRVLRRSDGRYTYLASDVAYHKNKVERGFTRLIDIWGADHHGYVARMKGMMQALGKSPETLGVILYQLVSLMRDGKPVAMSTRSGEFVTLKEVLDEVGTDACRFFFLLRAPDSHLDFDLELAKKQSKENPVYYVQYVHARCSSLVRESAKHFNTTPAELDTMIRSVSWQNLQDPAERQLIKKLLFIFDTASLCAVKQSPHYMTAYLMELADTFHSFYEHCRVLSDDHQRSLARLALVRVAAITIACGLDLLGVSAPERM